MKRVHWKNDVSAGYHVNLSAGATKFDLNEDDMYDLGLWAATTGMYTGAGCLFEDNVDGPVHFATAQKTVEVNAGFYNGTTYIKPLVALRDEPLSDPNRFHRIQIVGLDANISPWASWMNLGVASLCLRSIEQSRETGLHLKIKNRQPNGRADEPLARLARNVAHSPNLNAVATLDDGRTISAIDIQRELFHQASMTDHTDEEAKVLKNWEAVLHDIDGSRSFMKSKVGWMIKQEKLMNYAQKYELSLSDERLRARDRKWDAIGKRSVAEVLRAGAWRADMPSAELIENRRMNPCLNTRAVIRSAAIRESIYYADPKFYWSYYSTKPSDHIYMNDPLVTSLDKLKKIDTKQYYEKDSEDEIPPYMRDGSGFTFGY